jgi:acetyltransferase-like isoleucine patch superfamily enzyme
VKLENLAFERRRAIVSILTNTQLRVAAAFFFGAIINCAPAFWLRSCMLRMLGNKIGSNVAFHSWITWYDPWRKLQIGNNVTINSGCYLDNRCGISIGNNVNISHDVKIYTLGHDMDDPMCGPKGARVSIGDNAWIFPNVLIMPGVTVGEGAVIYPGSVVTRSVAPYEIVGGNPAKRIRDRIRDIRYTIDWRTWFAK